MYFLIIWKKVPCLNELDVAVQLKLHVKKQKEERKNVKLSKRKKQKGGETGKKPH